MSSVLARTKQIPTDSQYFVSLNSPATSLSLLFFTEDAAASTTSYVSGAAAGRFTTSNTPPVVGFDASGSSAAGSRIFRDMGVTIVSSGRTFRAVQLLTLDGSGQTSWTSNTTAAGVWQPGVEGITGGASTVAGTSGSSFCVFYFETGARGLGIAQGLVRYG
jgi:hypothetical protein